jgi:hypothetical protein
VSGRPPDLDELVGELPADERERLEYVHRLLLEAGPPPELPPDLRPVDASRPAAVYPLFPRRRYAAIAAIAAALALVAFGAGYLVADRDGTPEPVRVVLMTPPGGAPSTARASLAVFDADAAGNWPMALTVRDLAPLPPGQTYELWLTRDGDLVESCGTFVVTGGKTEVELNAPYRLRSFSGWVVTRAGSDAAILRTERI